VSERASPPPPPPPVEREWAVVPHPEPEIIETMRIVEVLNPVPVEKIVYQDRVQYEDREVEKIVFQDRILEVEKFVFKDRVQEVEKIVFQDRVMSVEKPVPVEKVCQHSQSTMRESNYVEHCRLWSKRLIDQSRKLFMRFVNIFVWRISANVSVFFGMQDRVMYQDRVIYQDRISMKHAVVSAF
jgi:hypothetical protein